MCASPMASPSNRQPFLDPYKGHYSIHVSCSADGPSKAVISGRQSRHGYGNHHLHRVPVYSTTNNPSRLPVYPWPYYLIPCLSHLAPSYSPVHQYGLYSSQPNAYATRSFAHEPTCHQSNLPSTRPFTPVRTYQTTTCLLVYSMQIIHTYLNAILCYEHVRDGSMCSMTT